MKKISLGSSPVPDRRGLKILLHAPRRLFEAYARLLRRSRGQAGVRCGICGGEPEPGRTSCFGCEIW